MPKKADFCWTEDPFLADGLGSRDVSSSLSAGFSVVSEVLISTFIEFSTVDAAGYIYREAIFITARLLVDIYSWGILTDLQP